MLKVIENYCGSHNLKFSTDPNPRKCKTKCIAFLQRQRHLPAVVLCGDRLPWVEKSVHLGNHFENQYDGMKNDIVCKRTQFIQKCCELQQEFSFAHPLTKILVNNIYNCHFTGSPLWDLFGNEVGSFERTWNTSMRWMLDLPLTTHSYLIEPLSGSRHLKRILIKRFISFLHQIMNSEKLATKQLLKFIYKDARSITGNNIRNILRLTHKRHWSEVSSGDIDKISYFNIADEEYWRVGLICEIMETKLNDIEIEGFTPEELNDLLHFACTS